MSDQPKSNETCDSRNKADDKGKSKGLSQEEHALLNMIPKPSLYNKLINSCQPNKAKPQCRSAMRRMTPEQRCSLAEKQRRESFCLPTAVLNSAIAGVAGSAAVYPLDLIKTRLQNQQLPACGEPTYKGIRDCAAKSYCREGLFGMYRGLGVVLLWTLPERAAYLASNDYFRYKLTRKSGCLPLPSQCLAGAGAGLVQTLLSTPMELLKIQRQDAGRANMGDCVKKHPTAIRIFASVIREKGIRGMYRGLAPTILRDMSFGAVMFPTFYALREMGPKERNGKPKYYVPFMAGLLSGMVAAFVTTPFDCVKTRIQTLKKSKNELDFVSVGDTIQKTVKCEGWRALFNGGACRMLAIGPRYSVTQMVYCLGFGEWLLGCCKDKPEKKKIRCVRYDK